MSARIKVLVADDSAFARKVLRDVLTNAGMDVVGIARDGLEALEKVAALKPDVLTLDLVMPNLDGLGVLAALPAGDPPRVVVVSLSGEDSALGISALHAGAVEIVRKPTMLAVDRLYDISSELVAAVSAAAAARVPRALGGPPAVAPPLSLPQGSRRSIVVIGASTGGPQALTQLIKALPVSFPVPVALVLHLPTGYTQPFAERLDGECELEVVEASSGLELTAGRVVVARAGMHLRLRRAEGRLLAVLDVNPVSVAHRPSVDALFESAAQLGGGGTALGVVLTGMGDDGQRGSKAIHEAGGQILTQSEVSCVVYGMPRCVDEAGLSAESAPIELMAATILNYL